MLTQTDEQLNHWRWRMAAKARNVIDRLRSGDFDDPDQIASMQAYVPVCVSLEDASLSFDKGRPEQISVTLMTFGTKTVTDALADKLEQDILRPLLEGRSTTYPVAQVKNMMRDWEVGLLLMEPSDIVAYLKGSNSRYLSYLQAKGILYRLSGSLAAVDAVMDEFDSSSLHRWSNRDKLLELIETVDQWGA